MAAEKSYVPVAVCEVCWLIEHTFWEPESMDEKGKIMMRMTGIDIPEKINIESVEVCADCGGITIAGIYELRDPATVQHLQESDQENIEKTLGYQSATNFTFSLYPESDSEEDGDYD